MTPIPGTKHSPNGTPPAAQVTQLLLAWGSGDSSALDALTPLVYGELKRLARGYMSGEREGHTLQATALVNEAYLKLVEVKRVQWQDRTHFFAVSGRLMRRILVDFARARHSRKRAAAGPQVSLDEALTVAASGPDLIALDDALEALAAVDPRKSRVVEMRFFGGLSVEETAEALSISSDTVTRDWKVAKAWLLSELALGRTAPDRGGEPP